MDFGKRLKEIREHLGYTQAEFAKACGIGKTAQYMYEKGDREPPVSYMLAVQELGGDVLYLLTGEISCSGAGFSGASSKLFVHMTGMLGLDSVEIAHLSYQRLMIEEERTVNKMLSLDDETTYLPWYDSIRAWLLTAKSPDACLDVDLLSKILAGIERYSETTGLKLPMEKRVRASMILYRTFKASGEVDQKMLSETISLIAE